MRIGTTPTGLARAALMVVAILTGALTLGGAAQAAPLAPAPVETLADESGLASVRHRRGHHYTWRRRHWDHHFTPHNRRWHRHHGHHHRRGWHRHRW